MIGFVYIWRDRKHGKFYIGSRWGHPNDGYVCSSRTVCAEYVSRPEDFRRRVLAMYDDRKEALAEEKRWLAMVGRKPHRLQRCYNRGLRRAETLVPLQFKMPRAFIKRFKQEALDRGVKLNELFDQSFHALLLKS